jgi:hypothetical protein
MLNLPVLKTYSLTPKHILLDLWKTVKISSVLFPSMWLISVLSQVLLSPPPSPPQASDNNFSIRGIDKLPGYSEIIKNWRITNYSYDYLLGAEGNAFVYLDPPYDIKDNLYGRKGSMHKGFDHDRFAADCSACSLDQLISYNSDQLVKDRFH